MGRRKTKQKARKPQGAAGKPTATTSSTSAPIAPVRTGPAPDVRKAAPTATAAASRKAAPAATTRPASRTAVPATTPSVRDRRRWIYGGLDLAFAALQAILIWKVVPNRLPSASVHLWTVPLFTALLGVGTLLGGRRGWWLAILAGSAALLSTIGLIVRIVISAAFLSGVYGAFGKAAAMTALISVALLVELVALLPIFQIKFLMTRAGRRAFGVGPS